MSLRSVTEKLNRQRDEEYLEVLKDRFAGEAMSALIGLNKGLEYQLDELTQRAYQIARAMLRNRQ